MLQTRVWISIVLACLLFAQQANTAPIPKMCDMSSHAQVSIVVVDKAGEVADPVHSHHHDDHGTQVEKARCQKCGKLDCRACTAGGCCMGCHSNMAPMALVSGFTGIQVNAFSPKTPYITRRSTQFSTHPYRPPISV